MELCKPTESSFHNEFEKSNGQSSCDIVTQNDMPIIIRRYYPIYLWEAVNISLYPDYQEEDPMKHYPIRYRADAQIHFLKRSDGNLLENGSPVKKIVDILLAKQYSLSDVVGLKNAELTKSFLKKKLLMNKGKYDRRRNSWTDPYSLIDEDTRNSVDQVMNSLDVLNAEVILTCGPDIDLRRRHFFYSLAWMATKHQHLYALKEFVKQIVKWNILDEEGSRLLEQEVFQKGNKKVLRILFQHRLDLYMKELFDTNALVALFGNPNVKIGFIKRKKDFRVNATGFKNVTGLHYAVKSKEFKKVKFLLDRGAKTESTTAYECLTPLTLALWEPMVKPVDNEKCAEILLQYGANPLNTQASFGVSFSCIILAKRSLAGIGASVYAPAEYLTKLALSYICMYDVVGVSRSPPDLSHDSNILKYTAGQNVWIYDSFSRSIRRKGPPNFDHHLAILKHFIGQDDYLLNFYCKCRQELHTLKEHKIRGDLTMFTVAITTGQNLIRLLNEEDQKTITSYTDTYRKDMAINPYYVNAIREHMRQFRKLVAHKNRAMLVISESVNVLAPYLIVLNKIVSYFTHEDLLMFQ